MAISIFFAKFFGIFFLILGCFLLIKRKEIVGMISKFSANSGLMVLSGMINIIIGLITVLSHHIWEASWTILITLLGYIIFLGGIVRLFMPEQVIKMSAKLKKPNWLTLFGVIYLAIGLFLIYKGFN